LTDYIRFVGFVILQGMPYAVSQTACVNAHTHTHLFTDVRQDGNYDLHLWPCCCAFVPVLASRWSSRIVMHCIIGVLGLIWLQLHYGMASLCSI